MELDKINLIISDDDTAKYSESVRLFLDRARLLVDKQIDYKADNYVFRQEIKILAHEFVEFERNWKNILRFKKLVWSDNDRAMALVHKSVLITQMLASLMALEFAINEFDQKRKS